MNKTLLTLLFTLAVLPVFAAPTTDFFAAVRSGDRAQVKTLLRKNQKLAQTTDKKGQTPFLVAVTQKDLQMVYVLAPFSVLSAAGPRGNAFHIAAQNEDEPMLKLLMQITSERNKALPQKMLNAPRNREDETSLTSSDGNTPLHVAAKKCNTRIYNYFASNGADDTLENEYGQTPQKILTACQKQKAWEADYKKKQAAKKAKNK
uniref:Uncharacterized protein n=1 Tax=uncultured Elusimicrobia bacterium TaxID=699876 RepID=A0A650EMU5_9BACT|nr:hypothetical protein Elusimicrob2101_0350 [uncultured Elusimicrobia bacterium]